MRGTVDIHVRAYHEGTGEEVEARVSVPAAESDLRRAAFAALQETSTQFAQELGLSPQEQMKILMARAGAMIRQFSEHTQ